MQKQKRKVNTEEEKMQAVELAIAGDKSAMQVSKDLNINYQTLLSWIKKYAQTSEPGFECDYKYCERLKEINRKLVDLLSLTIN